MTDTDSSSVLKRCTLCEQTKSAAEFPRVKRHGRDCLQSWCYPCRDAYNRKYKVENQKAIAALNRRHYQANREAIQERNRRYRERNREQLRERDRRWREGNPDKVLENARLQKAARRRGAPFTREAKEYARVILNDPCSYCGQEATTIDHVEPINGGGNSEWDNLAPACGACNCSKQDKSLLEFMLARAIRKIR